MARSEGVNRTSPANAELLDAGRFSIPSRSSIRRNKRKKATSTIRGAKGGKIKDSKKKGKIGAGAKDFNGGSSRRGRHKQDDKDRQPDRGVKGEDCTVRRSASELGIEWIGDFCPDGKPHFLIGTYSLDGGSILKCKNCLKHLWLPNTITEAAILDRLIDNLGTTQGYCKYLDKHKEVKVMIAKLQDLWYAKKNVSNNKEFKKLVISVMEDKEYDRNIQS